MRPAQASESSTKLLENSSTCTTKLLMVDQVINGHIVDHVIGKIIDLHWPSY
jgi:hypothetical protein